MRQKSTLAFGAASLTLLLIARCGYVDEARTVEVTLSPSSVELARNETAQLKGSETTTSATSTKINLQSDAFLWSVEETGGGTLAKKEGDSIHYIYTAPNVAGTFHVRIQSKLDSTQTARATLRVN